VDEGRQIRAQAGPQLAFMSTSADIALYGGGAGSGKTFALLLEAARHVRNPRFGAVIFRRLSPDITQEGGLWDTAGEVYPLIGGTPKSSDLSYAWPSGGKVAFEHLQYEQTKYRKQGAQIPLIGFDELTHFSESQFFYLMSRSRSTCGVRPYIRATTNPDAGSWVKRFIGPWVDRRHPLYPTPSGQVLWILRVKGVIQYGQTRAEMIVRYGPKARPKSLTFIKALIHDNPALLEKDPDYLANLEMQTTVERARLLLGDWDMMNEGLVYPDFGTIVIEPEDWPSQILGKKPGGVDWGFRDPFAGVLSTEDVQGHLWIDWSHYETRMSPTLISQTLPRVEHNEPRWWADPQGAALIAEMRLAGHDILSCVHMGHEPIAEGIAMVTQRIQDQTIHVRGDLGDLIDEAGKYQYSEKQGGQREKPIDKDNHLMDALRYLVVGNDRWKAVNDRAPEESQQSQQARAKEEKEEREEAIDRHYSVENEMWWNR
jgi:Terminase large subunit, T4likevirus-type, N-terminal